MIHFKNLSQKFDVTGEPAKEGFDPREVTHSLNDEINRLFTLEEIMPIVRKLKNNKAHGVDNIINEFLKNCPPCVMSLVVKLFNLVLNTGFIPTNWCIGIIVPLYKNKGSVDDPDNYRGITLLSCLGKLFTAVIDSRLTAYLEKAGMLGDEQAGFRAGYSTIDHVFVLHCLIDLYLSQRKRLYCAFVDYKKAFDLVDRASLWSKLISSNINGKIMRVIYNLYDNAKSCVRVKNEKSELFNCNIGVRQGDNLSPLLFAIYLNDFEYFLSRSYKGLSLVADKIRVCLSNDDVEIYLRMFVLLYADDTIVMAESPPELQKALNALHSYCDLWHLTVNTSKTKVVVFSRGKIRNKPIFKFGDVELDIVDDYVYLGVTFNYNGNFKKAISKQVSQAKRAMFSVVAKVKKLNLPVDIACDLFDKLVVPVALYGSEVWGFENIMQIEVFYRKFLRHVLQVHKSTASCIVYGETGRYKLSKIVETKMISFWCRILIGKQSKLSCMLYRLIKVLHDDVNSEFNSRWINKIISILDSCGFGNVWSEQEYLNTTWIKLALDLRLNDIYKQDWHNEVFENSQCVNYRIFKEVHSFESYLVQLNERDRKDLCKFRCGSHHLPCVQGRYEGIPRHNRLCNLCNFGIIGDEFHYLFECDYFKESRDKYIPTQYIEHPNTLIMSNLFNTKDVKILSKLAKFVRIIMLKFSRS